MGFLAGKRALIVGVATDRSIAWGIAQAMHREGAELAFSLRERQVQGTRRAARASRSARSLTMPLDVTIDGQIDAAFDLLKQEWGSLDILVHAVAFAPREALAGELRRGTTREAFRIAHDVSSYSLTALARGAQPLMAGRAGAIADPVLPGRGALDPELQRHGPRQGEPRGQRALPGGGPGSAGHPRQRHLGGTRSRRSPRPAFAGFRKMLGRVAEIAPLRRNVTLEDVGNAAAFLCSDLAAGITGEILYVDSGFSTVGMSFPLEAEG